MRYIIFITVLLLPIFASQASEIDSLLQKDKTLSGEDKVNNLVRITRHYFIQGDSLALFYGNQAIEFSKQISFDEGIGKANFFLGCWYDGLDNDKALKHYKISEQIFEKYDHPWIGYSYNNLSRIYRERGWYPEALEIVIKSLEVFEELGDSTQIATELTSIGYIYSKMGDYAESLKWQKKALAIPHGYSDSANIGLMYGRIGIIYDELGMYDSAHYFNNIAVAYFKAVHDEQYLGLWFSNIGNTFIKEKRYDAAEKYFNDALTLSLKEEDKSIIYINLGNVYTKTGLFDEAERTLNQAVTRCIKHKQTSFLSEAYYRKYELAEKQGKTKSALEFFKMYNNLNDSILNIEKTEQIARMRIRFETEQKEKELLVEKAEKEKIAKEKAQAEIKVYNRNKWIIGISSLTLILLFFGLYIVQRNRRKAQAEKDAVIIEEREKGLKAVITAQEDERKRIAKDLHDGIGQQLSGLKMAWQTFTGDVQEKIPGEEKRLKKLTGILDEAASDVRTISHQMMPRVLSESGLIPAIEDMLEKSLGPTKIKYNFETFQVESRFEENIEVSIYRVLQELINNIIKHAGALVVSVQLFTNKGYLILMVEDNGKGFELKSNTEGHGLLNIKSRINAINGEVSYNPSPESGTVATVRVPIK